MAEAKNETRTRYGVEIQFTGDSAARVDGKATATKERKTGEGERGYVWTVTHKGGKKEGPFESRRDAVRAMTAPDREAQAKAREAAKAEKEKAKAAAAKAKAKD